MAKLSARKLVDRLRDLDRQTTWAYYEMGRLLSSIDHGQLWDVLGYYSLAHMIDEELSYSPSTAYTYLRTYRRFQQLKYHKREALQLLEKHGITRMAEYLSQAKNKVSITSVGKRIEEIAGERVQVNFLLDASDHQALLRMLQKMGATPTDSGRMMKSSSALMNLVRAAEKRPELRVVNGGRRA